MSGNGDDLSDAALILHPCDHSARAEGDDKILASVDKHRLIMRLAKCSAKGQLGQNPNKRSEQRKRSWKVEAPCAPDQIVRRETEAKPQPQP